MHGRRRCCQCSTGLLPLLIIIIVAVGALSACRDRAPPPEPTITAPPVPVGSAGAFADVTAAAGITFVHRIPDGELTNIVESVGSGAAFLDYDGDGFLDIYFGNDTSIDRVSVASDPARAGMPALYRNRRDGTFEDRTERAGLRQAQFTTGVAAADYDNDGDADLYVVNYGQNRLYQNQGDATFREVGKHAGVADGGFGVGATFLDYDQDGDLDLYLANYLRFDPGYHIYYTADAFPGPLAYEPEASVLYQNQGDGTFRDVTRESGLDQASGRAMSVAAFDCDGDADEDIFVATDMTQNLLFQNDGHGRFTEIGLSSGVAYGESGDTTSAMSVDVADYDGDGHQDVVVSDIAYGSLYHGDGHGHFTDLSFASGIGRIWAQSVKWGGGFLDYDDDGDADLFAVSGGLHHLVGWQPYLLENQGGGRFRDAADDGGAFFDRKLVGRGFCAADFDNDGDLDVLITCLNGPPVLLRNDRAPRGAWLTLTLVGKRSNRDGFGARVTVTAGDLVQSLEHRCPDNYLCQGDPRLHIGLGSHELVDRLLVRWPSGTLQELAHVPARQFLVIEEPEP